MSRPKKLQGEKLESAKKMIEAGVQRSEICKALNVSYFMLQKAFGNVWKQKRKEKKEEVV